MRFGLRNRDHYQLLMLPRDPDRETLSPFSEPKRALETAWRDLWESGRIRADSAEAAEQALFCLCHGLISTQIQFPDGPWAKTVGDDAVDALLLGLIRPAATPQATRSEPEGGAEHIPKDPS